MPQFAVFRNPRNSRNYAPYLIDVQSDLLALETRVVIPLAHADYAGQPIGRLNPVYEIESQPVVLATSELVAVLASDLTEQVADLSSSRDEIVAAIDLLFTSI